MRVFTGLLENIGAATAVAFHTGKLDSGREVVAMMAAGKMSGSDHG